MSKKTWNCGDMVSIRLRKKDQDVANYLNDSQKSISDEFMEGLRLKISFKELEMGSAEVKAEHLILLQEFEKMAADIKAHLSGGMKKRNQRLDVMEKSLSDGNVGTQQTELQPIPPSDEVDEAE